MTMEISRSYNNSQNSYAEQVREKQEIQKTGKAEETGRGADDIKVSDRGSEPHDEYISSEKADLKPTGLYQVGQDGNGNRKIYFDDPNKSGDAKGRKQPGADGVNQGNSAEKCTGSTDKVDREIRKLKEKKQQLEQQLQSASGDEKKVRELEKKLAQIENELSQKDNDTYRRQHTFFY